MSLDHIAQLSRYRQLDIRDATTRLSPKIQYEIKKPDRSTVFEWLVKQSALSREVPYWVIVPDSSSLGRLRRWFARCRACYRWWDRSEVRSSPEERVGVAPGGSS